MLAYIYIYQHHGSYGLPYIVHVFYHIWVYRLPHWVYSLQCFRICSPYFPMDPVVPSERKWDWGIIYSNLEGFLYLLRQWPWIHRASNLVQISCRSSSCQFSGFPALLDSLASATWRAVCPFRKTCRAIHGWSWLGGSTYWVKTKRRFGEISRCLESPNRLKKYKSLRIWWWFTFPSGDSCG